MTKTLDSTSVYAYTTLISVVICAPLALIFEGSTLVEGSKAAIAKVGAQRFWLDLFGVGLLYHLYNQVCALACVLFSSKLSLFRWGKRVQYQYMYTPNLN